GAMLAQAIGAALFGAGLFLFVGSVLWAVHRQHLWPVWLQHATHPGRRWNTRHVRAIARRLEPLVASTAAPDPAPKPARTRTLRRAS
ncbi:MAG: hypothetical protein JOZ37_00005, partial [Actinobacteria bacterium]|nr:hypothetical protein [Actinomycetota bacterium]